MSFAITIFVKPLFNILYTMKKFLTISVLIALFATGTNLFAQNQQGDYLGLPGDNFNLYAAMKLFQESETLEGFERSLNDPNTKMNNLDLNGDNLVDYIMVSDHVFNGVHNIILQVAVNARELQDVAVFTVQNNSRGEVQIQLTGDEDLYGPNYIIEPRFVDERETPNPGYTNNTIDIDGQTIVVTRTTTYEIAHWPLIRFIFLPDYVLWRSSWHWNYYPSYWNPWQPYYWHYYYGYHHNWYPEYYARYRRWDNHRYNYWNSYYYKGLRHYSHDVRGRIHNGNYKETYSHPDQRKDGEAMYTQMHANQNRTGNPSGDNSRRTVVNRDQSSQPAGRRSSPTMTDKPGNNAASRQNATTPRRSTSTETTRPSVNQSTRENNGVSTNRRPASTAPSSGTTGRSSSTVSSRPSSGQPSGQSATTRRSPSTVTSRPASGQPSGQSATARRTPSTVTSRPASSQSSGQNAARPQATTRQSAPANAGSSNRRSNVNSRPVTTSSQNKATTKSESNDSRRR